MRHRLCPLSQFTSVASFRDVWWIPFGITEEEREVWNQSQCNNSCFASTPLAFMMLKMQCPPACLQDTTEPSPQTVVLHKLHLQNTLCGLLAKGANFNLLSSSRISRTWKKSAAGSYHWQLAYQDLLETWSERLRKVKASSHLPCSLCVQASTYTQYLFLQARGSL